MAKTMNEGQFWTMVQVASNTVKISSEVDVSAKDRIGVNVWVGKDHASAFTAGFDIVLQGRRNSAVGATGHWVDLLPLGFVPTTASEAEALTAIEPTGETVMACASTTNLVVGDLILIKDAGTAADSEFSEIVAVAANVSVTLMDGLETEKDSADSMYDAAVRFHGSASLKDIEAVRLVCKSWNTGQTYMTEAEYILSTTP